tara:strand:+ start:1199 stop:1855 length:657 start_codon:yes stop_codon:yes gene_type:complete
MSSKGTSHRDWLGEVDKLRKSLLELSSTDPVNVYQHFFLQAVAHEFKTESESRKSILKQIICHAVLNRDLNGTVRARTGRVLNLVMTDRVLQHLRLADIRNVVVFAIFKHCGYTVDTYFDRYSSPPGTAIQNECYSAIAHGNAIASAENIECIETILISIQVLKRFFNIVDHIKNDQIKLTPLNLNWIGNIWVDHIHQNGLSDLIWVLFLDMLEYENS